VLGNVVENALRHQPLPGRVRVSTSGLGGRTQVRVCDTGPGVPEDAREQIFLPEVHTVSSSFPSGHAMSAAIVYSTVAYLAARLHKRRWARWLVMTAAFAIIAAICISRLYLGVHYPSDVVAGLAIGLAWAGFCMATLEAIQKFGLRRDPQILRDETPAPAPEPNASSHH